MLRQLLRPVFLAAAAVFVSGASVDMVAHYRYHIYRLFPSFEIALVADCVTALIACMLFLIWQQKLRHQSRLLDLHLMTKACTHTEIRNALEMLSELADQCAEEEKKIVFREQIRQIEWKLN